MVEPRRQLLLDGVLLHRVGKAFLQSHLTVLMLLVFLGLVVALALLLALVTIPILAWMAAVIVNTLPTISVPRSSDQTARQEKAGSENEWQYRFHNNEGVYQRPVDSWSQ